VKTNLILTGLAFAVLALAVSGWIVQGVRRAL
jgi:hypothetical protein